MRLREKWRLNRFTVCSAARRAGVSSDGCVPTVTSKSIHSEQ